MLVIYENPGFEHSIASILLFQEDDTRHTGRMRFTIFIRMSIRKRCFPFQ